MYNGTPYYDVFEEYLGRTKHSLCYNGDINTLEQLNTLNAKWENCDKYMLGRGLIARPGILHNANVEGALLSHEEWNTFKQFHDEIVDGYDAYMCGDRNTLFKMKELWTWWAVQFPGQEKILKKIKKANDLKEYKGLVNSLHS